MSKEFRGQPIKDLKGFLEENQVKRLIDGAMKLRDKVFLRLLWVTGARVSEILGDKSYYPIDCCHKKETGCESKCRVSCKFKSNLPLRIFEPVKVEDVNLKDGNIILNLLKRKQYPPPKHLVSLDNITLQYLKDYIQEQKLQPSDPLFSFTRQRAFQIIRAVGESVGIDKVGSKKLHDHHLRHSNCVNYIRHNNTLEGLRKLQKRIGHANIETTAEYLQFGPEQKEETEDVFGQW